MIVTRSLVDESTQTISNLEQVEATITLNIYQNRAQQTNRLEVRDRQNCRFIRGCSEYSGKDTPEDISNFADRTNDKISLRLASSKIFRQVVYDNLVYNKCDECTNDKDCVCPPFVCSLGLCKDNYAVVFGSDDCIYCPRMYPVVKKLRKDGYIVFYIETPDYPGIFEQFELTAWPTTVIMNDGKPRMRFVGVTTSKKIARHLKTREQQGLAPAKDKP